jgi:hypothetical protein
MHHTIKRHRNYLVNITKRGPYYGYYIRFLDLTYEVPATISTQARAFSDAKSLIDRRMAEGKA